MRIIAGQFKGRKLLEFEGRDIRPTSDRTRESIFNLLMHGKYAGENQQQDDRARRDRAAIAREVRPELARCDHAAGGRRRDRLRR